MNDKNKNFLFLNNNNLEVADDSNLINVNINFVDVEKTYKELEELVNFYNINTVIAKEEHVYYAARLLWNNDNVKRYVLIDTDNAEVNEKQNLRAAKCMWNSVARRNFDSADEIKVSGWINSSNGYHFSHDEMKEFSDNLFQKVKNIVGKEDTVLEIGVASGISCRTVAPLVKKYYGVDISSEVLFFTSQMLKEKNIDNVTLINCEAVDINNVGIPKVKLILMNSVIQYFPGYNYFINILHKSINLIDNTGYIFFGDILDLELYDQYKIFRGLKNAHYNREQYYSKEFFEKLPLYFDDITDVIVSDKIGIIRNELTIYRFDVLLKINKDNTNSKVCIKERIAENLKYFNNNVSVDKIIKDIEKNMVYLSDR